MNALFSTLAQAAPTTQGGSSGWGSLLSSPMFPMILVLVVFYIFMIRGKRNQDRQRQDMLSQLKKGDRIQTIGGILGTVVEARETEVVVKVDESSNTKIRFARSAIHRVIVDGEKQDTK